MSIYEVKAKTPIFLHFSTHSISKGRVGNSVFWAKFYFHSSANPLTPDSLSTDSSMRREIPGFIYVHRCFWKVYFLYFVLPANLIYHLLPWKHALPPFLHPKWQYSSFPCAVVLLSLIHAFPCPRAWCTLGVLYCALGSRGPSRSWLHYHVFRAQVISPRWNSVNWELFVSWGRKDICNMTVCSICFLFHRYTLF